MFENKAAFAALFFDGRKLLDSIFILASIGALAFVSGVFSRLQSISISIVIIPGVLGFHSYLAYDVSQIILILIASSLVSVLPFSLIGFVTQARLSDSEDITRLTKCATWYAISALLIAQVLTIIPSTFILPLYYSILAAFILVSLYQMVRPHKVFNHQAQGERVLGSFKSYPYGLNVLSVILGGDGREWIEVKSSALTRANGATGVAFLSLFIALPASFGFMFPGIPLSILELAPDLSVWMLGYICWPLSLFLFVFAFMGHLFVRRHGSEGDHVWLKYILVLYLLACILRYLFS